MTDAGELRHEVTTLLRRLVACDTSNPPGREVQAVAVVEDYLDGSGVTCERIAKDPERPNLLVTLPGRGEGPSLAFLGHLDVVPVRREDWSVEPFAAAHRDGAIWGRGTIDMKCQVAATAVALGRLGREGFRPAGDLMLVLLADEEVGDAEVGAPYFVEQRPDLQIDFVVGEGAGERITTPGGPIYLLDRGVKATITATVTVRGEAADASLPDTGRSAVMELSRLLERLRRYRSPVTIAAELEPLLDALADGGRPEERVAQARAAHPALDILLGGLTGTVIRPTVVEASGPANVVPEQATMTMQCLVLPGTSKQEAEREVRSALGPGTYRLELDEPQGGSTSPTGTILHDAIEEFIAAQDPEARLVPCLGYGFSDCHFFREAYDAVAYGFIPFRHAEPTVNLTTKHGVDERVLVDDLEFQTLAALSLARALGAVGLTPRGLHAAANGYRRGVEASELTKLRIAENQSAFRDANEHIESTADAIGIVVDTPFICECSDPTCTEIVRLSLHEYEEVRGNPRAFFCVPGHQTTAVAAGAAVVLDERDGIAIVEKIGVAGEVAEARQEGTSAEEAHG